MHADDIHVYTYLSIVKLFTQMYVSLTLNILETKKVLYQSVPAAHGSLTVKAYAETPLSICAEPFLGRGTY